MQKGENMSTQKIFKKIYDSTYNKLIKYIACRCNNINDVDDILQETYLAFYKVLLNNKTIENYESYIYTIAKNNISKHFNSIENTSKTISIFQEENDVSYTLDIDSRYRFRK